ncbi:hypothetical protein [Vandammella animalimorsus]|uniref:hypothetical protein n=1 Tax=Vandammella animalimorsus TaxID=2029117 RepID=UPI001178B9DC|nr:hypothetical protein [Vandammella animalimorsus]
MQDGIKISELREMANKIFDEFEQMGCSEFVLNEDFYWDIHENERYDLKREPEGCAVGQLFDDIYFLRKMLEGEEAVCSIMFIHLAPILRYMALHVGFSESRS